MYIAHLEMLLKACWPKALAGDLKAIEVARRVLAAQARLFHLEECVGQRPLCEEELVDDEDFGDELVRFRRRHQRRGDGV